MDRKIFHSKYWLNKTPGDFAAKLKWRPSDNNTLTSAHLGPNYVQALIDTIEEAAEYLAANCKEAAIQEHDKMVKDKLDTLCYETNINILKGKKISHANTKDSIVYLYTNNGYVFKFFGDSWHTPIVSGDFVDLVGKTIISAEMSYEAVSEAYKCDHCGSYVEKELVYKITTEDGKVVCIKRDDGSEFIVLSMPIEEIKSKLQNNE